MERSKVAESFVVLAILVMAFSIISPWWGIAIEYHDSSSSQNVTRYAFTVGLFGSSQVLYGGYTGGGSTYSNGFSIYANTPPSNLMAVIASLLLFAAAFIVLYLYRLVRYRVEEGTLMWTMLLGTLGGVILFLAPLMLAANFPGALRQNMIDVSGSYTDPGHQDPTNNFFGAYDQSSGGISSYYHWGGDMGWALSIIASILLWISLIFLYFAASRSPGPPSASPGTATPFQASQPGYAPYRPQPQQPPQYRPPQPQPPQYRPLQYPPSQYQLPQPQPPQYRPLQYRPPQQQPQRYRPPQYPQAPAPPPSPSNRTEPEKTSDDSSFQRPRSVRRRAHPPPPPPPAPPPPGY